MTHIRRIGLWGPAALLFALMALAPAVPAPSAPTAQEIKAAFLYNFLRFIEWPARESEKEIFVCIAGEKPPDSVFLRLLDGKPAGPRRVLVKSVNDPEIAKICHVLFLGGDLNQNSALYLRNVATLPVLTVGESQGFLNAGGTINFLIAENRLRFEISLEQAGRSGLRISSKLLNLAINLRGTNGQSR